MGLLDNVDLTQPTGREDPLCNPCREGDCARCPTVLNANGIIESTFPCRCFKADPEQHEIAFDDRQDSMADEHFGRLDWDSEGRAAYTSVEHLF